MIIKYAFVLCLISGSIYCDHNLYVDQLRIDFLNFENELWETVLEQNTHNNVDPGYDIVTKFNSFDAKVQLIPNDILYGAQVIRKSEGFLTVYSDLRVIHDLYEKFRRYLYGTVSHVNKDYVEYKTQIATDVIVDDILHDAKNNVNNTIQRVYHEVFVNNKSNIIWDLFEILSSRDYICNNPTQSSQQVFYNLYNMLALIDLKGYILTQFAYMTSRLEEKGNNTEAAIKAREDYKFRTKSTVAVMKVLLGATNGNIYRCDPKTHIEGETYSQVTRLIQAHVQNEVDLNPSRSCTNNCGGYYMASPTGCYDSESDYCRLMKPCKGTLYECRFIESHMTTCISPPSSSRRYEYIEYSSGRILGRKTNCLERTVNSWFRWFVHCSSCLCLCDQESDSDRYFNLRHVSADINDNMIVTGMRLIKKNRIFHIQIQQGKLLKQGYVDQNSTQWIPVDAYSIFDRNTAKSGQDYFKMTYSNRKIYLDDLTVDRENFIITGVRFVTVNGNLQLRITVTPFDFTTGKLDADGSYEIGNPGSLRERLDIPYADVPTYSSSSEPNFQRNKYVEFTMTDLDKDAGQTTIPFIDIQPVFSDPPVPLKSAGIYYKGTPGYGGFLGLKIGMYQYTNHLSYEFPNVKERIDPEEYLGVVPQ